MQWFYAYVERRFAKMVTSLGVVPVDYSVLHKSHPEKTMVICTTGYIPYEGDPQLGGIALKLGFRRVGGFTIAATDTFKRVYKEDGSYWYPKVAQGGTPARVKGQPYWENWEIQGSSTQSKDGSPKFSLLHYFRDEALKDLDAAAAKFGAIIRYQWDGAGPHNEAVLLKFLNSEFGKRGWIFDFQASKLPILNVHDACVFPALSKIVSANQALQFDGTRRILAEEAVWEAAQAAYAEMGLDVIARAYAGHAQIVCAMIDHEGDAEQFTRGGHGAGHHGIRRTYASTEDGVVILEECIPSELSTGHLKYAPPTLDELGGKDAVLGLNRDQQVALGTVKIPIVFTSDAPLGMTVQQRAQTSASSSLAPLVVDIVAAGGAAEALGVLPGDVICRPLDGVELSLEELQALCVGLRPLKLVIKRKR